MTLSRLLLNSKKFKTKFEIFLIYSNNRNLSKRLLYGNALLLSGLFGFSLLAYFMHKQLTKDMEKYKTSWGFIP